jgi:formate hydrogenlyase transcriptional activator
MPSAKVWELNPIPTLKASTASLLRDLAPPGTIFPDEVGEIPLDLQTKMLRVLQEQEFERRGSSRTFRTDARLIAATNRDLGAMVGEQTFPSDRFYRLNVIPIHVRALRERAEDIPFLVRHFAQHFARNMKKQIDTISSETMSALVPGRETSVKCKCH